MRSPRPPHPRPGTPPRRGRLGAALAVALAVALAATGCATGNPNQAGTTAAGTPSSSQTFKLPTFTAPPEHNAVQFRTAEPGRGTGIKIGYISLSEAVPFIKLVSDGIKKQAEAAGAQLVFCDSQGDAAKALDCAKNFATQGVQGYLNFQQDSKAAPSICAAGPQVPVIAIDIHQPPCEKAFMGANNAYAGQLAGQAVGEFFKANFACKYDAFVSLEQPGAGEVNDQRMGGYRKGFESVCGKIHDLKQENAFRIDTARSVFADVLTSLQGAHRIIVVGINDDSIEGALAAAKTANRQNDLFVAGQGADPSSWCEIKNNRHWVADTAYFPERYGEIGVPYLLDMIKGKPVPDQLLVPHQIINANNIEQIYHPSC